MRSSPTSATTAVPRASVRSDERLARMHRMNRNDMKKKRFSVIEHWTCEECGGEGEVYEDAREQTAYRFEKSAAWFPDMVRALAETTATQYRSERVPCRAC